MENHRLFIVLDQKGLKLLHKVVEHLINNEDESSSSFEHNEEWISVLMYPSYMESFDVEELPDVFFEWARKCYVLDKEFLDCLQKISGHGDPDDIISNDGNTEDGNNEDEFISASIHELADKLPAPGSTLLEVYVFGGEENFKQANLSLLASLKRFEICYPAYFALISEPHCNGKRSRVVWKNFIDFNCISVDELLFHLKSHPLWAGTVNVRVQQCNGDIPLRYYFMFDEDQSKSGSDAFIFVSKTGEQKKILYDSKIEIVSMVKREAIPLHLINPQKFILRTFSSTKDEEFNFFENCDEDKLFVAILKYDECSGSKKFRTSDWMSHVKDPFTHYLNPLYSENMFYNHRAVLIEYDKLGDSIVLYFFLPPEEVNVTGFLELLKKERAYASNDVVNASEESSEGNAMTFYRSGADIIPPWEWCEKNAWHAEENSRKVVKSISRLKSDEFFMQGVMIPGIEPLNNNNNSSSSINNNNTEHDLLATILTMFDKNGQAITSNLQPIPVIEDRLLKNIKCEESLTDMDYSNATKVIGHGLDYCIDSLGTMHLSDRLIKVQKRFIPEDTINITSGKLSKSEESTVAAAKKNALRRSKVVPLPTHKQNIKKVESRAEKHKRRLKTIVEGTVVKYGQISQKHGCYQQCCQTLFNTCVLLVKELKNSKDLNNQMKQFAKTHVKDIVATVRAKHSSS